MDVPGLPFDTVGLNLATGALKVNPAYKTINNY